MRAEFKVKAITSDRPRWVWQLVSDNGRVVAQSGTDYGRKQHCKDNLLLLIRTLREETIQLVDPTPEPETI